MVASDWVKPVHGQMRMEGSARNPAPPIPDQARFWPPPSEQSTPATGADNSPASSSGIGVLKASKENDQVLVDMNAKSTTRLRSIGQNGTDEVAVYHPVHKHSAPDRAFKAPSVNPNDEPSYTTLQYYRHLGPTAIAPRP